MEEKLTYSGLEVESVTSYSSIPGELQGLIAGKVVSCEQHPNADRLKVTQVLLEPNGVPLQIVCGAPNVQKGQMVIVAPVGTTLYPLKGDPFVIKQTKIRGELSLGMICADDEIGLGDSHEGIHILPPHTEVGTPVSSLFEVYTDNIITIGLTANRGDAASHIGVATDLSALFDLDVLKPTVEPIKEKNDQPFQIHVQDQQDCIRYCGVTLHHIQNQPTPPKIRRFLQSLGVKPQHIIVDVTNYVMLMTGQPLHAFDALKLSGKTLQIGSPQPGTTITTLDSIDRICSGEELAVMDETSVIALAGVMGCKNTAVDQDTHTIFLESACFNPSKVRKTAKKWALSTDASFRFERGTDPDKCMYALRYAFSLLNRYAGAETASSLIDLYQAPIAPCAILLRKSEIKRICGIDIPDQEVERILLRLGFTIQSATLKEWSLHVPTAKTDVTREIDVIEELIRIYGFDKLPFNDRISFAVPGQESHKAFSRNSKKKASTMLRSLGFSEMQNNSLSPEKSVMEGDPPPVRLLNPLSSEMSIMRTNLMGGALTSIGYNQKFKNKPIKLFEFGYVYHKNEDTPLFTEQERLIIAASGNQSGNSWESPARATDAFYVKNIVKITGEALGIPKKDLDTGVLFLGEPSAKTMQDFDLKPPVVIAEIDWKQWMKAASNSRFELQEIHKFPIVRRDLSLVINNDIGFDQILSLIQKTQKKGIYNIEVVDVFEGKPLPPDQKSYSIAFYLYDPEKTMSDKQIDHIMGGLMLAFEEQLHAIIRKG